MNDEVVDLLYWILICALLVWAIVATADARVSRAKMSDMQRDLEICTQLFP